jgi:hypothetical protein
MDNAGIGVSPLSQKSPVEGECQDIGLVSRGIGPNDEPGKKERTAKKGCQPRRAGYLLSVVGNGSLRPHSISGNHPDNHHGQAFRQYCRRFRPRHRS